ncbi:MAG: hypothetical protein ABSB24_16445 [Gaiellaceae bacterium]|jgi:predicted transcriptional regulator
MAKTKTTVYIDDEVLRAARILAARSGRRDSEVVEEALREYAGLAVVERVRSRNSDLSGEEALKLAYEELHAMRRERRHQASSG